MWMYRHIMKHYTTFDVIDHSKNFEENFRAFLACDMSERGDIFPLICFSGNNQVLKSIFNSGEPILRSCCKRLNSC